MTIYTCKRTASLISRAQGWSFGALISAAKDWFVWFKAVVSAKVTAAKMRHYWEYVVTIDGCQTTRQKWQAGHFASKTQIMIMVIGVRLRAKNRKRRTMRFQSFREVHWPALCWLLSTEPKICKMDYIYLASRWNLFMEIYARVYPFCSPLWQVLKTLFSLHWRLNVPPHWIISSHDFSVFIVTRYCRCHLHEKRFCFEYLFLQEIMNEIM